MGVKGLWSLLQPVGHSVSLESLENEILAVDISIWINQSIKGIRNKQIHAMENAHLLGLFNRICKLLYYKIKPIFVFDGGIPELKRQTINERIKNRQKALEKNKESFEKLLKDYLSRHLSKNDMLKLKTNDLVTEHKKLASWPVNKEDVIFQLPENSSTDFENNEDIEEFALDVDLKLIESHDNDINIDSKEFKALPAEIRHEVLNEMIKKYKKSENKELPSESNKFSNLQMSRLLAKRKIQKNIEDVEKEIKIIVSEKESDEFGVYRRVASEKNTKLLMITHESKNNNTDKIFKPEDFIKKQYCVKKDIFGSVDEFDYGRGDYIKSEGSSSCKPSISRRVSKNDNADFKITLNSNFSSSNFNENFINIDDSSDSESSFVEIETSNFEMASNFGTSISEQKYILNKISKNLFTNKEKNLSSNVIELERHQETPKVLVDLIDSGQKFVQNQAISKTSDSHSEIKHDVDDPFFLESCEKSTSSYFTNITKETAKQQIICSLPCEHLAKTTIIEPASPLNEKYLSSEEKLSSIKNNLCMPRNELKKCEDENLDKKLNSTSFAENLNNSNISDFNSKNDNKITSSTSNEDKPEIIFEEKSTKSIYFENNVSSMSIFQNANKKLTPSPTKTSLQSPRKSPICINPKISPILTEKERKTLYSSINKNIRQTTTVGQTMIQDCQYLLSLFGIPYIISPMEAEAQCATLEMLKITKGTITDDSDVWLFGGQTVYKDFFNQSKFLSKYRIEDIQKRLKLDREYMICLALLTGSDYTNGIEGVGPIMAMEILSEFEGKGLTKLKNFKNWWTKKKGFDKSPCNKTREKFIKLSISSSFPSEVVFNAYFRPMVCTDLSKSQFTWGNVNLNLIRELAIERFCWNKEKVDQILSPVIKKINDKKIQTSIDRFIVHKSKVNAELFPSKRLSKALSKISNQSETSSTLTSNEIRPNKRRKIKNKLSKHLEVNKYNVVNLSEESSED